MKFNSGYCVTVFIGLLLSSSANAQQPLTICYDAQSLAPYALGEGDVPELNGGILTELITSSAKKAGFKPHFYRSSWNRCVADIQSGKADAVFPVIWSPERDEWAVFPKEDNGRLRSEARLWKGKYHIFVRQDSTLTWDGHDFGDLTFGVGAPLGYVVYQQLEELDALSSMTVGVSSGFKLTARNRIDGYVIDKMMGEYLIDQLELGDTLTLLPRPFMHADWHLPFSTKFYKQNSRKIKRMWKAIEQQRGSNGRQLIEKYHSK